MKAKMTAVLLSLFVITLPAHSQTDPKKPPIVKQKSLIIQKIDLNKADLSTLTGSFKGIGKKRAEAIIAYRDSHHGIKSIEELAEVKGIGQHFVDKHSKKLKEVFTTN